MVESNSQPSSDHPSESQASASDPLQSGSDPVDAESGRGPSGAGSDPPGPENPGARDELEGPGWMPAILAATALMGIVGFVVCGFSTWLLFQKRTELAVRTLRGPYIDQIEQSHLDPQSKSAVVKEINTLIADLENGKYENWQAAAIMQRLQRLPVIQWGEIQAVAMVLASAENDSVTDDSAADGLKQLSRAQRAVELGLATVFDFEDVLEPIRRTDDSAPMGYRLVQPIDLKSATEVVHRAKLLADRCDVPDRRFEVRIETILRREIQRGATEGAS